MANHSPDPIAVSLANQDESDSRCELAEKVK